MVSIAMYMQISDQGINYVVGSGKKKGFNTFMTLQKSFSRHLENKRGGTPPMPPRFSERVKIKLNHRAFHEGSSSFDSCNVLSYSEFSLFFPTLFLPSLTIIEDVSFLTATAIAKKFDF